MFCYMRVRQGLLLGFAASGFTFSPGWVLEME